MFLTRLSNCIINYNVYNVCFVFICSGRRRRSESRLMEKLFVFNHSQEDNSDPYNEELERLFEED